MLKAKNFSTIDVNAVGGRVLPFIMITLHF